MEFWGVEVNAGEPVKVKPDDESIIHLSQAALGESKKDKGNESVTLFVNVNGKKMVLGTLLSENIPQLSFDLVFEKEVELSHNWKNGSVYFCGYQSLLPDDEEDMLSDEDSEDEEVPVPLPNADNGAVKVKTGAKPATAKADAAKPDSSKQKAKPAQPNKDMKANDDSDEDEDQSDDDDEEDGSDEEDESEEGMSIDEDSDDDDDDSESEDEETPKKVGKGNKRPIDSATRTPVPSKKKKAASTQKTDSKKGGHTATPHPAKGAKASANGNNIKAPQTPKSGGKFSCGSCDRSFGSDAAFQSHSNAKHGK